MARPASRNGFTRQCRSKNIQIKSGGDWQSPPDNHGIGTWASAKAKLLQNLIEGQAMMGHDFAENGAQGAGAERVVVRNGQVVFAVSLGGEATMGAELAHKLLAKGATQRLFQISGSQVTRQFHAVASSSSMTRCRRMTAGAWPGSKWQSTASRTLTRS